MTEAAGFDEHVLIPIDAQGNGPCDEDDACVYVCWCGEPGCTKWTDANPDE